MSLLQKARVNPRAEAGRGSGLKRTPSHLSNDPTTKAEPESAAGTSAFAPVESTFFKTPMEDVLKLLNCLASPTDLNPCYRRESFALNRSP